MTTLAALRERIRQDLRDTDAASYRWTDSELDRHLQHAVRLYSHYHPIEQRTVLATTSGSRDLALDGLAGWLRIVRVEYPLGLYPPSYVPFTVWGELLRLRTDLVPVGDDCAVFWLQAHTVDEESCTVPAAHEDLITTGAAGFAATAWASYATNRVSIDPRAVEHYTAFAEHRLAEFHAGLERLTRRLRARQLTTIAADY